MHVRSSAPLRLLVVAALLLIAVGAGSPPTPVAPTPGPGSSGPSATASGGSGVLRVALVDPVSIDPAFASDQAGRTVVDALFDPLTELGPDGTVRGAAAEDWRVSEDARTFTFTLRDARFHDGVRVAAENFVRAFTRVVGGTADHAPASAELLADVEGFEATHLAGVPLEGVTALDRRTLRIRLQRPRADLPEVLSHPALAPVPPVADADPEAFARRPVGNGPFRLDADWEGGGEIRLVRDDQHPATPPLDGITFRLYAGEDADQLAYQDLRDGVVDVAPAPSAAEMGRSDGTTAGAPTAAPTPATSPPRTVGRDTASVYAYGFVTDSPPFDDPVVRRAFSLLIDREAVAPASGPATPADALLPPGVPGHRDGTCTHCRFDPVRAKLLLASRPLPPVRLLVTEDRDAVIAAGRVAEDVAVATGVEVTVTSAPVTEYLDRLDAGEVDVFGFRWDLRTPTPDDLLSRWFSSRRAGVTDLTRYRSAEVDDLLARARATLDRGQRLAHHQDAEQRVLDDAAVAPAWYGRATYAAAASVRDLRIDPWGRLDLSRVSLGP